MSEQRPEWQDRKVLLSETLFMSFVEEYRAMHPDRLVQVRWPEQPVVELVAHWEPVITVVYIHQED